MKYGWYPRSAEFMQDPTLEFIRWLSIIGDTIFAVGPLAPAWFIIGSKTGRWVVQNLHDLPDGDENHGGVKPCTPNRPLEEIYS